MAIWNVTTVQMGDQTGASLQAVINSASSGDTINLPAGTWQFNVTSPVNFHKSLVVQGTGPSTCQVQNLAVSGVMWDVTSQTDGHIRMSGIYFYQSGNISGNLGNALINFGRSDTLPPGPGNQWTVIITNCTFDPGGHFPYVASIVSNGIICSGCTFTGGGAVGQCLSGFQITCNYGTEHWNTPDTMGAVQDWTVYNGIGNGYLSNGGSGTGTPLNVGDTAAGYMGVAGLNCTYIEDSTFANGTSGCNNVDGCARVVMRHCTFTDCEPFGHGQDSSTQGARHFEIYNCAFHNTPGHVNNGDDNGYISCRGAVMLVANNTMDVVSGKGSIIMQVQQINRNAGPGACQTAYPANRQCGIGWSSASSSTYGTPVVTLDGTGEASDPIFIWNNTGTGGQGYANYVNVNPYSPDDCGNGLQASTFIVQNRDYYVGVARPGWVPYTYPHPLVSGAPVLPSPPVLQYAYAGPTPSFVQANSGSVAPGGSSLTIAAPFKKAQTSGNSNIVIVWPGGSSGAVSSVVDTAGNTYTLLPGFPRTIPGLAFNVYVYVCTIASNQLPGANTVTVTQPSSTYGEIAILEYTNIAPSPFDAWSSAGDGSGNTAGGSSPITPANATDLIISGFICDINFSTLLLPGTVTPPPGWNLEATASANPPTSYGTSFVADLQTFSLGTYAPLWTQTVTNPNPGYTQNPWSIFSLALKSSLAGAPPTRVVPLAWNNPGGGITGYTISYGTTNGGPYPNSINPGNVLSYTVTGLASGTYYFVITATSSAGTSANSNQVTATVTQTPATPVVGLAVH